MFGYNSRRFWSDMRHQFYDIDGSQRVFITQLVIAFVGVVVTTWISLIFRRFLQEIRR